jgi:hypothetical protein
MVRFDADFAQFVTTTTVTHTDSNHLHQLGRLVSCILCITFRIPPVVQGVSCWDGGRMAVVVTLRRRVHAIPSRCVSCVFRFDLIRKNEIGSSSGVRIHQRER